MATAQATFAPPTTCESFVSTYGKTVSKISKNVARGDADKASDLSQSFWLEVCATGIEKIFGTAKGENEIEYIICSRIWNLKRWQLWHSSDVLDIDHDSIDENTFNHHGDEIQGSIYRFEVYRCTQRDGMKNDVFRVLFMKEFLQYVETHDPEMLPVILTLENSKVLSAGGITSGQRGRPPKYQVVKSEQVIARIIALAEKFEGKPLSGRKSFYIEKDTVGGETRGARRGSNKLAMTKSTRSKLTGAIPRLEEIDHDLAQFATTWLAGASFWEAGAQMGWTPEHTGLKYGRLQRLLEKFSRGML